MKMSKRTTFNENGHLENFFLQKSISFQIVKPCDIQSKYKKFPLGQFTIITL